jgi:hypothetical protein
LNSKEEQVLQLEESLLLSNSELNSMKQQLNLQQVSLQQQQQVSLQQQQQINLQQQQQQQQLQNENIIVEIPVNTLEYSKSNLNDSYSILLQELEEENKRFQIATLNNSTQIM